MSNWSFLQVLLYANVTQALCIVLLACIVARVEGERTRKCVRRNFDNLNQLTLERIDSARRTIERHELTCKDRVMGAREAWQKIVPEDHARLERIEGMAMQSPLENALGWFETLDDETLAHLLEVRELRKRGTRTEH